ncbi:MAG: proline dehydrogenase family protein [Candidatus Micrarchaeia archaeon]
MNALAEKRRNGPEGFSDVLVSRLPGIGRYTAGPRIDDAVARMKALSDGGIASIANVLGEHDIDPEVVKVTAGQYRRLVSGIAASGPLRRPALSLKPTQFGLDHAEPRMDDAVAERMLEIAGLADGKGIFVWYDMEDRNTTDFTLRLYRKSLSLGLRGGVALQANLRRSHDDLKELAALGRKNPVHVRLIKGIYKEPAEAAYQERGQIHSSFARLIRSAFESGGISVSVGTHHPDQIIRAIDMGKRFPGKLYDLQFLLGAVSAIPAYLGKLGMECAFYVPSGPRFLDYGIRRLKENPGGMLGLFAAPLFEKMNLLRIKDYVEGRLIVDRETPDLRIIQG